MTRLTTTARAAAYGRAYGRRIRGAGIVLVAGAVALAGCTGMPVPGSSPPSPAPAGSSSTTTSRSASPTTSTTDDDAIPGSAVSDRLRTFLATRTSLGVTTLDCDPLPRRAGARGSCRLVFADGAGYAVDALVRDATTTPPDLAFDLTLTTPIPSTVVETNVLALLRKKFPTGAPVAATCRPLGPTLGSRTTCLLRGSSGLVYAADVTLSGWDDAVPRLSVQVAATPTTRPI